MQRHLFLSIAFLTLINLSACGVSSARPSLSSPTTPQAVPSPTQAPVAQEAVEASPQPTVRIYTGQPTHSISPLIYGMSSAPVEYLADLNLPFNSWGGNANTRYNWQLGNAWNAASDWFYMNVNFDDTPTGESSSDRFVRENMTHGTATRIALPTLGWVAKDTTSCSFPLDSGKCGNADGATCENPGEIADPADTSVAAAPEFIGAWVQHLHDEMGYNIDFFAMDNEPELWGVTHYDVHPDCTTYDEIYEHFVSYAEVVSAAAPESEILGPVTCCWWFYWNSMAGAADKKAHDNEDFLPWFLQQMAVYEQQNGERLLDVLDIHYYPSGGFFSDDVSQEMAAGRLRSTQSLWNPDFVDESWIDEPVYLIPRMKALIDEYYPGTKLAISEWNFGADGNMNGALTIADVLGIYGREDVDLAAYWRFPEENTPGYHAFKMYLNFDGEGSRFGDLSLPVEADFSESVGAYAALDSVTGNVHLMLINRDPVHSIDLHPVLDAFVSAPSGTVYRYSAESREAITVEEFETSSALHLLPYSISLFVFEPAE